MVWNLLSLSFSVTSISCKSCEMLVIWPRFCWFWPYFYTCGERWSAKLVLKWQSSRIFSASAGGLAKSMAAKPKFFLSRRLAAVSAAYRYSMKQTVPLFSTLLITSFRLSLACWAHSSPQKCSYSSGKTSSPFATLRRLLFHVSLVTVCPTTFAPLVKFSDYAADCEKKLQPLFLNSFIKNTPSFQCEFAKLILYQ